MIDRLQFLREVIAPTLGLLELDSWAARSLLLGTALHESGLTYLRQRGGGPALGVYQVEPATHADVWANYLRYHDDLGARVETLTADPTEDRELVTNLAYATAIARLVYRRDRHPLPPWDDALALATYYKRVYNTPAGRATVERARRHFLTAIYYVARFYSDHEGRL